VGEKAIREGRFQFLIGTLETRIYLYRLHPKNGFNSS